jgi:hypothetical protein
MILMHLLFFNYGALLLLKYHYQHRTQYAVSSYNAGCLDLRMNVETCPQFEISRRRAGGIEVV